MARDLKTNVASEPILLEPETISNKAITLFYTTLAYLIVRKEMI